MLKEKTQFIFEIPLRKLSLSPKKGKNIFMSTIRFKALESLINRTYEPNGPATEKISDYFGKHVFGDFAMREYLSKEAYDKVRGSIEQGTQTANTCRNAVSQLRQLPAPGQRFVGRTR